MFYLIFPNCVKVTNTANLIENEQKIKPLLWPSEVGNRKIRALNLRLSGQILDMQSWFCRCVWGLVSNHMFMHNWRSERSDMLCSLICIPVHQWKHNSSAADLHLKSCIIGMRCWCKDPSLSLSLSPRKLFILIPLCIQDFAVIVLHPWDEQWNKALTKEYISILMLSDRCVQNWDFRGYIWWTR